MKSAILVIDEIKGMEKWVPHARMLKTVANTAVALKAARAKGVPIIYMLHKPLGKRGIKIYDEIKPHAGDHIIGKNHFSSFFKTRLEKLLKSLRVKRLILTGVSTHWCVLSTALDGSYKNYKLVLLRDCTAAPSDARYRWSISWMKESLDITVATSRTVGKYF